MSTRVIMLMTCASVLSPVLRGKMKISGKEGARVGRVQPSVIVVTFLVTFSTILCCLFSDR